MPVKSLTTQTTHEPTETEDRQETKPTLSPTFMGEMWAWVTYPCTFWIWDRFFSATWTSSAPTASSVSWGELWSWGDESSSWCLYFCNRKHTDETEVSWTWRMDGWMDGESGDGLSSDWQTDVLIYMQLTAFLHQDQKSTLLNSRRLQSQIDLRVILRRSVKTLEGSARVSGGCAVTHSRSTSGLWWDINSPGWIIRTKHEPVCQKRCESTLQEACGHGNWGRGVNYNSQGALHWQTSNHRAPNSVDCCGRQIKFILDSGMIVD